MVDQRPTRGQRPERSAPDPTRVPTRVPARVHAAEVVRSAQHPLLKRMGAILAGKERGACVLEGDRLIEDARASGTELEALLVSTEREERARELERAGLAVTRISADLLDRRSALKTSPGIAAIARAPEFAGFERLATTPDALVLVVAGVADPGNLGALARSAEAAGAAGLVLLPPTVHPFGDKALRGSMGSLLRLPVASAKSAAEAVAALRERGFRMVAAATRGGSAPSRFDWSGRVALWVGSETGLEPGEMRRFERVTLPMAGRVESLNVTVAASLLLFAAGRAGAEPR